MKSKNTDGKLHLSPRFKLWISSPQAEGVFGDGKYRLLRAIKQQASLRAAADSLKISYRKAWGDLKKAEECLGVKFIEKHRGGVGGGETTLTEEGERWLCAYEKFRSEVEETVMESFEENIQGLVGGK